MSGNRLNFLDCYEMDDPSLPPAAKRQLARNRIHARAQSVLSTCGRIGGPITAIHGPHNPEFAAQVIFIVAEEIQAKYEAELVKDYAELERRLEVK